MSIVNHWLTGLAQWAELVTTCGGLLLPLLLVPRRLFPRSLLTHVRLIDYFLLLFQTHTERVGLLDEKKNDGFQIESQLDGMRPNKSIWRITSFL